MLGPELTLRFKYLHRLYIRVPSWKTPNTPKSEGWQTSDWWSEFWIWSISGAQHVILISQPFHLCYQLALSILNPVNVQCELVYCAQCSPGSPDLKCSLSGAETTSVQMDAKPLCPSSHPPPHTPLLVGPTPLSWVPTRLWGFFFYCSETVSTKVSWGGETTAHHTTGVMVEE